MVKNRHSFDRRCYSNEKGVQCGGIMEGQVRDGTKTQNCCGRVIRVTKLRHECLCCHYEQNSCHKITTRILLSQLQAKFVSRNYDTNLCLSCHYKQNSCHKITTRMFVLPLRAKFVSRNYDTNLCFTFATTSKIRVTKLRHESLSCHYKLNSCHKITTRMFVLPLRAKFVSRNYDTNFTFATTSKIRVTKLRHESLCCH